jgi:beta-N-acetylhexosaminidase
MSSNEPAVGLGPVMCDVAGFVLTAAERERLMHPLVGGVILFSRNFENTDQLVSLCAEIHALRQPALLIAVDHEGGRVQRFRQGFTRLPPMHRLGDLYAKSPRDGLTVAQDVGYVLAAELLAHGVDLSFTPVLDLDYGHSSVIGDRAFHADPHVVALLAHALCMGLREAGMGCVGKHFPGHGFAQADSHVAIPVDERSFEAIWDADILPYRQSLGSALSAVMPAHVNYPQVAPEPAGFSRFWLQDILRGRLGFNGVIFSDDLSMEGASVAGDIVARASAARAAGCDMVLVCNRPDMVDALLAAWQLDEWLESAQRVAMLQPVQFPSMESLSVDARFQQAWLSVQSLG